MNKYFLAGLAFLLLLSLAVEVSAQTDKVLFASFTKSSDKANIEGKLTSKFAIIEANYMKGLISDNIGVRTSSAYFLGEMKSEKALSFLMKMFREAKTSGEKLVAAWSLLKIGDSRGVHLVKWEVDNGENKDIKDMVEWLYNDYSLKAVGKIE